jgi:hypothetical protein
VSLFFEPFDALESEFLFVMLNAFFDILFSVAQHATDQPSQMMATIAFGAPSLARKRWSKEPNFPISLHKSQSRRSL